MHTSLEKLKIAATPTWRVGVAAAKERERIEQENCAQIDVNHQPINRGRIYFWLPVRHSGCPKGKVSPTTETTDKICVSGCLSGGEGDTCTLCIFNLIAYLIVPRLFLTGRKISDWLVCVIGGTLRCRGFGEKLGNFWREPPAMRSSWSHATLSLWQVLGGVWAESASVSFDFNQLIVN